MMNEIDINELKKGKMIITNGKIYALCDTCKQIIRVNKPFIGSMHVCDLTK